MIAGFSEIFAWAVPVGSVGLAKRSVPNMISKQTIYLMVCAEELFV